MKGKKILIGGLLIVSMALLAACGEKKTSKETETKVGMETNTKGEYNRITAEEAKKQMESNSLAVILDVRTQEEYDEKHIPGAILIPNETIGTEPLEALPDLNQEILIYCRSGNRSEQAAKKLIEAGYTNVFDFGGINDWPYETVSGNEDKKDGTEAAREDGTEAEPSFSHFTATDLDGNTVTEDIFKDYKLTMINIWGTFCGPCIKEMPELGDINREYKDKGFQIVGIVADTFDYNGDIVQSQVDAAKEIVSKTGADYLHLLPSADLIEAKIKDVTGVPETIFVDSEGNQVGKSYLGAKSEDDWKEIIDGLLE